MGASVIPSITPTRKIVTLTSGTSWTVPAGVTFVNVTLYGAGSGGSLDTAGGSGQVIQSNVSTTPGAAITYAIGAGSAGTTGTLSGAGGTTTFTGATSASGGAGADAGDFGANAPNGNAAGNGGGASPSGGTAGNGGAGRVEIEYWVA